MLRKSHRAVIALLRNKNATEDDRMRIGEVVMIFNNQNTSTPEDKQIVEQLRAHALSDAACPTSASDIEIQRILNIMETAIFNFWAQYLKPAGGAVPTVASSASFMQGSPGVSPLVVAEFFKALTDHLKTSQPSQPVAQSPRSPVPASELSRHTKDLFDGVKNVLQVLPLGDSRPSQAAPPARRGARNDPQHGAHSGPAPARNGRSYASVVAGQPSNSPRGRSAGSQRRAKAPQQGSSKEEHRQPQAKGTPQQPKKTVTTPMTGTTSTPKESSTAPGTPPKKDGEANPAPGSQPKPVDTITKPGTYPLKVVLDRTNNIGGRGQSAEAVASSLRLRAPNLKCLDNNAAASAIDTHLPHSGVLAGLAVALELQGKRLVSACSNRRKCILNAAILAASGHEPLPPVQDQIFSFLMKFLQLMIDAPESVLRKVVPSHLHEAYVLGDRTPLKDAYKSYSERPSGTGGEPIRVAPGSELLLAMAIAFQINIRISNTAPGGSAADSSGLPYSAAGVPSVAYALCANPTRFDITGSGMARKDTISIIEHGGHYFVPARQSEINPSTGSVATGVRSFESIMLIVKAHDKLTTMDSAVARFNALVERPRSPFQSPSQPHVMDDSESDTEESDREEEEDVSMDSTAPSSGNALIPLPLTRTGSTARPTGSQLPRPSKRARSSGL